VARRVAEVEPRRTQQPPPSQNFYFGDFSTTSAETAIIGRQKGMAVSGGKCQKIIVRFFAEPLDNQVTAS
jgi:hypothetical protein